MDDQIENTETATQAIQDTQGRLIGYACDGAKDDDNIYTVATSFYFGLQYPIGQQEGAIQYINQALLEHVANEYDLISGSACDVFEAMSSTTIPIITDRFQQKSNLVSIQIEINPVDLFASCQDGAYFIPTQHDCQISQLLLTGKVWDGSFMPDVITLVKNWLEEDDFSQPTLPSDKSPYSIHYLGGEEMEDQMVISDGSGRSEFPAYNHQYGSQHQVADNRNTVAGFPEMSALGKAFLSLMVLACMGLILAFLRKQKQQREIDAAQPPKELPLQNQNKDKNDLIMKEIDLVDEEQASSPPSTKDADDSHRSLNESISDMSAMSA